MPEQPYDRLSHVVAWGLLCAALAQIWVGGLVTTCDAGMAVPDWPNTFGHVVFLYPPGKWLAAPGDAWGLFLQQGHRLLGTCVGLLSVGLAVVLWRRDRRRWMKWLALAAVAGVCLQGLLGGLRVIRDDVFLAGLHGCTAPLLFALGAAVVTFTSRRWQTAEAPGEHPGARTLHGTALLLACGVYLEIVLGAPVRHVPASASPDWFAAWVWLHLIVAGLLAAGAVWLLVYAAWRLPGQRQIARLAVVLGLLLAAELLSGGAAWMAGFGFPEWFRDHVWAVGYTVVEQGRLQVWSRTAHAALGPLCLATAVSLVLWSRGRLHPEESAGKRG